MFSDSAVASIIHLTLEARGFVVFIPYVTALNVMLELSCGNRVEAVRAIHSVAGEGSLKACLIAVKTVNAFMGKTW